MTFRPLESVRGTVRVVTGPETARVDALFHGLPSGYGSIARVLRRTVRSVAPSLQGRVKLNNPFWMGAQDVLCLQCFPDHLNLGVLRGAELTTQYPRLEGTGNSMGTSRSVAPPWLARPSSGG